MGEVLEKIYNQNLDCNLVISTEKLLALRLDLLWRLSEVRNDLPHALRPVTSHDISGATTISDFDLLRLRIFLTLHHKAVELLINRAILYKYLDYRFEDDVGHRELELLQTSGRCSLEACQKNCSELIGLVAALLSPAPVLKGVTLCGAWHFSGYRGKCRGSRKY